MKYRIKVVTDIASNGSEIVTYYPQCRLNWVPWWSYYTEGSYDTYVSYKTYEEAENYLKLVKKYPIIEYYYM